MRLIDADKLKEQIEKDVFLSVFTNIKALFKKIDEQPTAYNVDKVVEQMESCPYTQDWIEIVKAGGKE